MAKIRLECEFGVTWGAHETPALNEFLDKVVDHLAELEAGRVAVASDPNEDAFVISMVVDCLPPENPEDTYMRGMGTLRTAFHVNDACTPNWPTPELAEARFTKVKERSARDSDARELANA